MDPAHVARTGPLGWRHSAQALGEKLCSVFSSSQGANPLGNPLNVFFSCREQSQVYLFIYLFPLTQSIAASSFLPQAEEEQHDISSRQKRKKMFLLPSLQIATSS